MGLRFKNYDLGYRIVSLALEICVMDKLSSQGLEQIYVDENRGEILLLPEAILLSREQADLELMRSYNNYDVFEIWENGVLVRKYNDRSGDNYFFITGKCNSNCIMCPSPEYSRRTSEMIPFEGLMKLAEHIPSDVPHMTITGGEPFLMGEQIFPFLRYLKEHFAETEFLFLTNGRVFAIERYLQQFCENAPDNSIVAIPVHGSCEEVHDRITQTAGSFAQTRQGVRGLLKKGVPVEIRLVVSKLNVHHFCQIAELIIREFRGIEYVSVIAMEMTGSARQNLREVWIPYRETFACIADGVRSLVEHGFDVKLYNFPLCTVEKPFWTLCEKSISESKVRFAEACSVCRYQKDCSGVFAGTLQLERDELRPIA